MESTESNAESAPDAEALERLQHITDELAALAKASGRPANSVQLIAVSKRHPLARILTLARAGQHAFGENYVDEAVEKMQAARTEDAALAESIEWHFIGRIQSNKTRAIAEHFDWVHSVDREKIARRLSDHRPTGRAPLNCLIEVNVSGEESKGGVPPSAVRALAEAMCTLPGIVLRGLMALPAPETDPSRQQAAFREVAMLAAAINDDLGDARKAPLDVLSMGTSGDYAAAIAAGATHVRIGTAVFGARPA